MAATLLAGPTGAATPDSLGGDSQASTTSRTASSTANRTAARAKIATQFALKAAGYGTRVEGGQLPVVSGQTAYAVIGCTNKAGMVRKNYEAAVTLPGLGTVDGVRTKTWTSINYKKHKVAVNSVHNVAKVVLGGTLTIAAVKSHSTTWHDRKGFHTRAETSIGSIKVGAQSFPIPTPNQPITIPGVAKISLGMHKTKKDSDGASTYAEAVQVKLLLTDTVVRIAHTAALMGRGITYGRFHGSANGTQVRALADNVKSGPTPLSWMPCQGTHGVVKTKSVLGVDLAGQIVVGAVENQQMGKQNLKKATGFEQSTVAAITLGPLTINAIKARANVTRLKGGKMIANADGTTIGEIVVNGDVTPIPDPGQAIEIPGLLKLEANVVDKMKYGIDVVAIRITLLDGTGAVIDLGHAKMEIKPSHRVIGGP
ncbi:choice-of-anchor P family protein [Nocardioides sp.]|uniref:choice-of-anchor P family protein n=1 Tax=Nocardioides sp. TaxID=35761 RepID=UPI0031FE6F45